MESIYNTEFPSYMYASSMVNRRVSKQVHDNVHGNIYLDPPALKFIDTEQFQRLRDLKQLGLTYLVYPGAVHTRFEHSIGVYWLAGETINRINIDQGFELEIDHFDIQTVKLAGLLHDVGHGPFSHLFEKDFLPQVLHSNKWSHEEMSLKMIDYIVDEHNIEIESDVVRRVKEMIVASSEDKSSKSLTEKRFLYDIVANGRNGIDVDKYKFDYIVRDSRACGLTCSFRFDRPLDTMRVIGDEICYRAKEYLTIHKLFSSRADLHRTVYSHAKVKAIDFMLVDALVKANNHLDIKSCIDDPAEYWKFCNEFTVPKDQLEYFKDITPQDIICSQKSGVVSLKEEDIVVSNIKIDMTRGRKNPLESINFFKDYESDEKFPIPDEKISLLLPECYQDKIVRVYSKKPELVEVVSDAFENFQVKNYGMKTQVHGTPQKKRQRK
nr:PREDICTED: deoxynucleoside triphosphate triphosphohydrolase SAMHD1 homolog isoform X3 [Daucus carota subsp. sativus]